MVAEDFREGVARTMTDRDLIRAVGKIDPADRKRRHLAGIYIRELGRRDIRLSMEVYELWKERGRP